MSNKIIQPEIAWTVDGLVRNLKIEIDNEGIISSLSNNGNGSDSGLYLPGFINSHSHAFQRGLRGRGEAFAAGSNSFWSWREEMYKLVNEIDEQSFYEWCHRAFLEMRTAGITTVGEFHYLHHEQDQDYKFDKIVLKAASDVGIRIVLLHGAYLHGGIDEPLAVNQQRFNTKDIESWWVQVDSIQKSMDSPLHHLGVVAHSIRAVDPESLTAISEGAMHRGMPLHLHVEEQRQEIASSIEAYNKTPMALLNEIIHVSPMVTAVHCTHTSASDLEDWISSGGNICICPLTEGNLADGVCDMHRIVSQGGCVSIGTDSNARISMLEEVRNLEYVQRVTRESRGICIDEHGRMSDYLLAAITKNGARCLGIHAGSIEEEYLADFVVLDLEHSQLGGVTDEVLLEAICCGVDNSVVMQTIIGGNL